MLDLTNVLQTLEHRGLSDEGIARLSPAAAAASKLINSGMSLTDVYSQLVKKEEEKLVVEDENRYLHYHTFCLSQIVLR